MRKDKVNNEEHAERRIQATRLLERLQAHRQGRLTMTRAQILAARIVIGKVMPMPERRTHR